MIQASSLYNINFYKSEIFHGSSCGMNYRIERLEQEDSCCFLVTIWQGPYNFKTTTEKKTTMQFPFTNEALQEIADFLNQNQDQYIKPSLL